VFSGLGKESISIMFAVFSVGVTLFASSPQFTFDDGDDSNQLRKLYFLEQFDPDQSHVKDLEKFILYSSEIERDAKQIPILPYKSDFYIQEKIAVEKFDELSLDERLSLELALVVVYYNEGNTTKAEYWLNHVTCLLTEDPLKENSLKQCIQSPPDLYSELDILPRFSVSLTKMIEKTPSSDNEFEISSFTSEEEIMMKYWYAYYTIKEPKEFPGCEIEIFPKKISDDDPNEKNYKCTHKELWFVDGYIKDLNYESFYFDVGNKYQKNTYSYFQDEIKAFFESYMNWLIIGVVLITLVGWVSISKKHEEVRT